MAVDGRWQIVVASPIGRQEVRLDLVTEGATVSGSADTSAETGVPVKNGTADGDSFSFSLDLKKPFPMTVVYRLAIEGDAITGTAKAGPFPAAKTTGSRA